MQTSHTFNDEGTTKGNGGTNGAKTAKPTVTWIDVVDPTVEELDALATQYGLADRTFDEAYRRAARPSMRRFEDHVYVVAFSGSLAEIDMYLGPSWLITVRRHDPDGREWDPQPLLELCQRHDSATTTSGQLFATLMDDLIDGYFDTTDVLEDKLEVIEDAIFSDEARAEQSLQHDLFGIRRELL